MAIEKHQPHDSCRSNKMHPTENSINLMLAQEPHIESLLPLVADYHAFDAISSTASLRQKAVMPLLEKESELGRIWLIKECSERVGYIAICFGYSIEFAGKDAFIDEFFIVETARGRGLGTAVLQGLKVHAEQLGIAALHLEVGIRNRKAKKIYAKAGFSSRERFQLMTCKLSHLQYSGQQSASPLGPTF